MKGETICLNGFFQNSSKSDKSRIVSLELGNT